MPAHFDMRAPCQRCGVTAGEIERVGLQDVVRCAACKLFAYNASRVETKQRELTHKAAHSLVTVGQRFRVLQRDRFRCAYCGTVCKDGDGLHVDHIFSVDELIDCTDGIAAYKADANLITACRDCNLGKGKARLPTWAALALLRRALKGEQ